MVKCSVGGCKNYQGMRLQGRHIKFCCFPKDRELCKKWLSVCRSDCNFRIARICSAHFTVHDWRPDHVILNVSEQKKRLKRNVVPTLNLPQSNETNDELETKEDVQRRKELVQQAISCANLAQSKMSLSIFGHVTVVEPKILENKPLDKAVQKPVTQILGGVNALRQANQKLKLERAQLLVKIKKAEAVVSNMRKFLTKGQIKRLQNPHRRCIWSYEDVANSISLFTTSPIMYQMLWRKNYPLPSPATLKKWVSTLKLKPGLITSAIKSLADCSYSERDKLCVLSFYEIRLKPSTRSNNTGDTGLRPYKFGQVFIARGLVSNWKQIVYYNFDCMMPGLVFKEVILALRNIGFSVVAGVSGVGPRKLSLWKELKIDENNPYIEVSEGEKVFFFANVPHLIKRLRDSFIETGFFLNDVHLNVDPLKEMLQVESSDLWVSHDLNSTHISPNKVGRHNLQVALQLFSKSVADSIRRCVSLGKMNSQNAIECSDFIQVVEEWFRVFNSKCGTEDNSRLSLAYGLALNEQNVVLNSMTEIIKNLKIQDDEDDCKHPFQKGILLNNSSLPQLFEYLQEKYNDVYVITNNLNTDDTEQSFAIRKSYGGVAYQPTAVDFKYRLRSGILSNLNVQIRNTE